MQGRLTLHVRILVHISQVSGVFLKSQCQCSCIDTLTKLLVPCPYGKCFKRCWHYISQWGFNNNLFFIKSVPAANRYGFYLLEKVLYLMYFCYVIQLRLWQQATDSSFCRTALLGFVIRVGTPVNMKEGDNQRDQGEGLLPLSLSLMFSPSCSLFPYPYPYPLGCWLNP